MQKLLKQYWTACLFRLGMQTLYFLPDRRWLPVLACLEGETNVLIAGIHDTILVAMPCVCLVKTLTKSSVYTDMVL